MGRLIPLYVYWLRAPMLDNQLVYVGCAKDVESRRKAGQKRYGMILTATQSKPYYDYGLAGARETKEIEKNWLTSFNIVRKSAVSRRYSEKCSKTSAALKGQSKSFEHRANLSKSRTGRKFGPHSKETNRKIGLGNKGKLITQETRNLLRGINLGKVQSAETVAKRVAKNTGKKRTSEQREHLAASKRGVPWSSVMHAAKVAQYDRKNLLLSGYGHPWRIKDLPLETQEALGAE